MIDDARIVAERRAGPSATFIDPMTLGSIEISRGPGSVAYGSDSIGGIVHLRPRDPIAGQPQFRYDVWTSFGGSVASGGALEATTDVFGGAMLASVHARSASDGEDGNGDPIANSQYRDRGMMLRFVRDSAWGRFRIGAMSSSSRDVGAPANDPVVTFYPDEDAHLLTFALDTPHVAKFDATSLRASIGSYEITTHRIRTTGVEVANVQARDGSLRLSGERANTRSRVLAGVDFVSRFNVHSPGTIDDADRHDAGVFASVDHRVATSMQLSGGVRYDHLAIRNSGGTFGDRSRNDHAFSGFAATSFGPFRNVTTTLQVARGYREPTLSDRYFRGVSGRGFVVGNPDLEPERSTQFDGAVRWSSAQSRVGVFAYHYRIRDLVERFRNGSDFNFRNRGEATVRGIELEAATRFAQNFEFVGGAAIARGEADGAPIDDIAPSTLHASVHWSRSRASAYALGSWYARDERPGPVEVERAGFASIDVGTAWRFASWGEVRVIVRNLTDAQHFGSADAAAAFAPGRSLVIGVSR